MLEKRLGAGNVLVVLTADHGVAPLPEVNQSLKLPAEDCQIYDSLSA